MSFEILRNRLATKLKTISSIQEVHTYPTEEFGGFPAAVIASARMDSAFETTNENKRTYIFTIYLFQELESKGANQARRIIEGVCDDVIEALDEDQGLTGIESDLPSQETMVIAFPVVPEILEDPKYIRAELEIRIVISFSIT